MDYKNYKCPVCEESFKDGDDVVVCPECGTPHHRKCYEEENRCAFADKHAEGFDFEEFFKASEAAEGEGDPEGNSESVICPRCRAENPKDMFYCGKCGFPIGNVSQNSEAPNGQQPPFQQPFQQNGAGIPFGFTTDPMGGVEAGADFGDGVTAGECSKYVQKNTPYFMRVFSNIKNFSKGRFSFCAFFFGGGYLLYRKMYKLGGLLTGIMVLLLTAETYINYSSVYTDFLNAVEKAASQSSGGIYGSSYFAIGDAFLSMEPWKQALIGVMLLCSLLNLILRIIVGFNANKWYFSHCKKQVNEIKKKDPNPQQALESKGGVNVALAVSMYAAYLAINYIPYFFQH